MQNEHLTEDDYRSRVLTAIEKPASNRFLSVINSSIFIWAISAIFLTLGGSYFTLRRECFSTASSMIVTYRELTTELYGRHFALVRAIGNAKNLEDVTRELGSLPHTFGRYRDFYIADLEAGRRAIDDRTEGDPGKDLPDSPYLTLFSGQMPAGVTDADLPKIKEYAGTASLWLRLSSIAIFVPRVADCSISKLYSMATGTQPKILRWPTKEEYLTDFTKRQILQSPTK